MADINRVQPNLYEIEPTNTTEYAPVRFYVSAQDLRDISDWCLLHMRELEQEAQPGHSASPTKPQVVIVERRPDDL